MRKSEHWSRSNMGLVQRIAVLVCTVLCFVTTLGSVTTLAADPALPPSEIGPLPEGVASFGATGLGDWLYVYSGHTGKTHQYSKDHMLKGFYRVSLDKGGEWEKLEMGPPAQGVALIADDRFVYRIGGMQARNEPGASADLHSLTDVAQFDPTTKKWRALPELPQPRSSHRAAVLDNKLYIFGGWSMRGGEDGEWFEKGLVLDLKDEKAGWKEVPQPAVRRALEVIAFDGRIWMVGGLTEDGDISNEAKSFDPKTQSWKDEASIPGISANGNGIAGCVSGNRLYMAGMDGIIYRLASDKSKWENAGKLPSARIHHRMVGWDAKRLIVVGGASSAGHLKSTDAIE